MKYYIAENGQQVGPMEESELLSHGMTVNTLVWHEGMPEWLPAGKLPELAYMFGGAAVPPQQPQMPPQPQCQPQVPPQYGQQQPMGVMPKTWLVESILVTLFCCLPFGIVGIVKASKVSSLFGMGDYEGANKASEDAKKWTVRGLVCGIIYNVLAIGFYVWLMMSAGGTGFLSSLD